MKKIKHKGYKNEREARATGQALNSAILTSKIFGESIRIVFLCGGICTLGMGKVISHKYNVEMRSIK